VAVLIPCYNEAQTVGQVVRDFRAQLPDAEVWVFDNRSTDRTVEEARRAGALIGREPRPGKGYVIRTMFRQVEADVYVMVDGDGTYPADRVHELLRPVIADEADMAIGSRLLAGASSRFKILNQVGNRLFRFLLNTLFRVHVTDLFSGYRAMNRRVVKGLPFLSRGFESETELTVKCLGRDLRIVEIPVSLAPRPAGSYSKLHIVRDGLLNLETIVALLRDYKPLTAFGSIGAFLVICGLVPGVVVIKEFLETGLVPRLPSAVLAVGLIVSGLLVSFVGLVLHSIARHFQELDSQMQRLLEDRTMTPPRSESAPRREPPSSS